MKVLLQDTSSDHNAYFLALDACEEYPLDCFTNHSAIPRIGERHGPRRQNLLVVLVSWLGDIGVLIDRRKGALCQSWWRIDYKPCVSAERWSEHHAVRKRSSCRSVSADGRPPFRPLLETFPMLDVLRTESWCDDIPERTRSKERKGFSAFACGQRNSSYDLRKGPRIRARPDGPQITCIRL